MDFTPYIGTVSEGTLRWEDMVDATATASVLMAMYLSKTDTKQAYAFTNTMEPYIEDLIKGEDVTAEAWDIITNHCPEWVYFGTHPGDGRAGS